MKDVKCMIFQSPLAVGSGYKWENIYYEKLKVDLRRINKSGSMWSKAHNYLIKF